MEYEADNPIEFQKYFEMLMIKAARLQSIASLADVHNYLFLNKRYQYPSWSDSYRQYRNLSDEVVFSLSETENKQVH